MRDATIDWVEGVARRRGFDLGIVAPEGARSPTGLSDLLPTGMHGPEMIDAVKARGFTNRQRIRPAARRDVSFGHMGDHSVAASNVLREFEDAIVGNAKRRRFVRV